MKIVVFGRLLIFVIIIGLLLLLAAFFLPRMLQGRTGDVVLQHSHPAERLEEVKTEEVLWMARLEACVREHMAESYFSVEDLAVKMGVGRKELYRNIRSETGMTANQYIQEIRLQAAREKMQQGERITLNELAKSVGFQSGNYLSRLYRQRFGKSPLE